MYSYHLYDHFPGKLKEKDGVVLTGYDQIRDVTTGGSGAQKTDDSVVISNSSLQAGMYVCHYYWLNNIHYKLIHSCVNTSLVQVTVLLWLSFLPERHSWGYY